MTEFYLRRKRATRGIILILTTAFLLLSVVVIAQQASAQPAIVQGKVWNQIGTPLEGANVTVKVYDSSDVFKDVKYCDATDEDGFYTVSFGFPAGYTPQIGDTIEVNATHSSGFRSNSTVIETIPPAEIYVINVTIWDVAIPEFGIGQNIGLPLAIIGVMAIFVVMARKRKR